MSLHFIDCLASARRQWASTTILTAAAAIGLAAPAAAQDSEMGEAASEGQLDSIIVTANRREESLQDVAVSADVLGQERVDNIFAAGADTTALAGSVPGLNVESSNGRAAPRFYIRGLGNTDFDLAASQPVSVIMDEIVLENVTLKSFPIFDVDRIEVLRGPQGTLFGRNTPAGIVKIDTIKPSHETDIRGSVTYGSFDTFNLNGAIGGSIVEDKLAVRVSGQLQSREDWIDNGFTGEDDALGGFRDLALRGQALLTPDEEGRFSMLASVQYRDLDGSSTFFHGNAIDAGDNDLRDGFDRDTVFYDGGGGNIGEYEQFGASLRLDYEFDAATLTSITGYYESEGSSRGDVDGGFIVRDGSGDVVETGPGLILFESDTRDSIDLQQFTQEIRLASNGEGPVTWQVGAFFFESDFDVETVGFTFPPPVTVNHQNDAWAVFGQVSAEITDMLTLTGGLRYSDDEKTFVVLEGSAPQNRRVEDDNIDWDISLFADVTDDASLYARVANAFRAPTIQGRDVAFFNPPSVAQSEDITSYEAGFKGEFADRTVRVNGALFYYTVDDPQFTAVGGAGNLVQLINANEGEAWGFELDTAFQVTPEFQLTLGVAYTDTQINDDTLAVGVCAQCTVTDPLNNNGFALVDGNPFPNAPRWSGDFTASYTVPVGNDGEVFAFTDWTFLGETNFLLYESREFNADSRIEGGLRIGYRGNNGQYEVSVFARNITDEVNVLGVVDFNNNTAFVNEPRVFGITAGFNY